MAIFFALQSPELEVLGLTAVFGNGGVDNTASNAVRILETHHAPTYYIPTEDLMVELRPVDGSTYCEWKGYAQYWSLHDAEPIAWSYPNPAPGYAVLRDHVAFYVDRVDAAWVGSERARAQPGGFYGGWVTSNLLGIVKGGPGTRHW